MKAGAYNAINCGMSNSDYEQIIRKAYAGFNERNIDEVLNNMHKDVAWPNGWEGGYVYGHDGIRNYWTRQWKEIDPEVRPLNISSVGENIYKVTVHQYVRDLSGNILADTNVFHTYFFEDGLIKRMEIEE
jgi:hypothetical protein